jgi:16S rRNA (guanine1207-N2)-methyltransferase
MDQMARLRGSRVISTSLGRAQFAAEYCAQQPTATVVCWFLDVHLAQLAQAANSHLTNLQVLCESDLPAAEYDLAALPLSMQGNAELTRELLQETYTRLCLGGQLIAATDNPQDHWLHAELQKFFEKVTRIHDARGMIYLATKTKPLKRRKSYGCVFSFRDGERDLQVMSRPGVFSHRRLDQGARALIDQMVIQPDEAVFEIGCGSGAVTVAAATRASGVQVDAIDSNPRAVECTLQSAALNGVSNITATLTATGLSPQPGSYHVALANPPYYSQDRLTEIFVQGALQALQPQGRLYLVTKHAAWYETHLPQLFRQVQCIPARGYLIFACQR